MKHLKTLGLLALAMMALTALDTPSASATELYQRTEGGAVTLSKGTKVVVSATGGTGKFSSTGGSLVGTCTGQGLDGNTSRAGSSTTTVTVAVTSLVWTGCMEPTETSVLGELEIHHIAGTTNGTVIGKNTAWRLNTTIFEETCEY